MGAGGIAARQTIPEGSLVAPNGRLGAVREQDVAVAERLAATYHLPGCYGRVEDLLESPDIDAVYVATPTFLHAQQVIAAARAANTSSVRSLSHAQRLRVITLVVVEAFFNIPDAAAVNALEIYGTRGAVLARGTLGQTGGGSLSAYLAGDLAAGYVSVPLFSLVPCHAHGEPGRRWSPQLTAEARGQ